MENDGFGFENESIQGNGDQAPFSLEQLLEVQKRSLEELTSIHRWIAFFGVLTLISLGITLITILGNG